MSDEQSEEKTEPATERKLRKQREEGSLPQTQNLTTFAALAVGLLIVLGIAPGALARFDELIVLVTLAIADPLGSAQAAGVRATISTLIAIVGPLAAATIAVSTLTAILYHKGVPFSAKSMAPKAEKLSPSKGLKRIFGRRGWVETGTSLVRLLIWSTAAFLVIRLSGDLLFQTDRCGAPCVAALGARMFWWLAAIAIAVAAVSLTIETLLQKAIYLHEQRMTKTEKAREEKDMFGAPEIRKARQRISRESGESAEHAGLDKASMCFFSDEGAVGIRMHPVHARVPRIAVIARDETGIARLREHVRRAGFPELRHPRITGVCLRSSVGAMVDESIFEDLAHAMNEMFSH